MRLLILLSITALLSINSSFAEEFSCSSFSIRPVFEGTPEDKSSYKLMTEFGTSNYSGEYWVKNEILLDASSVADVSVKMSKPFMTPEQLEEYQKQIEELKKHPDYKPLPKEIEESFLATIPEIVTTFKEPGKFEEITKNNLGKRLAIVLDGRLLFAPKILEPTSTGSGVIMGNFTQIQARRIAKRIKNLSLCKFP